MSSIECRASSIKYQTLHALLNLLSFLKSYHEISKSKISREAIYSSCLTIIDVYFMNGLLKALGLQNTDSPSLHSLQTHLEPEIVL